MLRTLKISFNKSSHELLEKIKNNPTIHLFGPYRLHWKNVEKWEDIELKFAGGKIITFFNGKGKIKIEEQEYSTILYVNFTIPPLLLLGAVLFYLMAIYASIQFGIANYGTSGFLPSVITPVVLVTIVLFIGLIIQRVTMLRWFKHEIQKALE